MTMDKKFMLLLPALAFSAGASYAQRPNVILIMADDLGYGDTGFTGNGKVLTPNMDRLASEGVVFDRFYAGAPLSSPTRATVLTGRNPFRTGVFTANAGIIRPEEITIPEILREQGYRTGHFGKWHLGTLTVSENDANRARPGNEYLYNPPAVHGYDTAFVTESKVPTCDPMKAPAVNDGRFWDSVRDGDETVPYGTSYWDIDGNKITDNLDGDDSRVIMDRVIPFIGAASAGDTPFLAVIWFHAPHLPCVASPEYAALYEGMSLEERNYFGCITAMDAQIGRLADYLEDIGEYDNTAIFFCSDNGPELDTPGSAADFTGKKRSLHEGGIRVPAFCICPGIGRKNIAHPCSTLDYLPTIADMLDLDISGLNVLDGESFYPSLAGGKDKRKKPIVHCSGIQGSVITDGLKLYMNKGGYELYDIRTDPYEKNDIIEEKPAKAEKLKKVLMSNMEEAEASFYGREYGTDSYERMGQKWHDIFGSKK